MHPGCMLESVGILASSQFLVLNVDSGTCNRTK